MGSTGRTGCGSYNTMHPKSRVARRVREVGRFEALPRAPDRSRPRLRDAGGGCVKLGGLEGDVRRTSPARTGGFCGYLWILSFRGMYHARMCAGPRDNYEAWYRGRAEEVSQSGIFCRVGYVVGLFPFHWNKLRDDSTEGEGKSGRYVLNAASRLNLTLAEERDPTVPKWGDMLYLQRLVHDEPHGRRNGRPRRPAPGAARERQGRGLRLRHPRGLPPMAHNPIGVTSHPNARSSSGGKLPTST